MLGQRHADVLQGCHASPVGVEGDGDVIAFDDTGKVKWKVRATSDVSIPPVVGYGIVVVRSGDYRIQAFDANSGERVWSVQRPGPSLALRSVSQMVLAEGLVITGLPGGKLMAIASNSGNVQWEGTVATPRGASDLERLTDVVGAPRIAGNLLCAVAYQGRIVCFDVTAGGRTYELPYPFFVLATQNPIEQEGTYPLPEAQLDRFMLNVRVPYPNAQEELENDHQIAAHEIAEEGAADHEPPPARDG